MTGGERGIRWRRLLAEGLAIVISILLAFAIDAWWDGRQEAGRERILLEGLLSDFEASRPGLVQRLELSRRMAASNTRLLEILESRPSEPVSVPDSILVAVLGGPTYEPSTSTLDAAVASGDLEIIGSTEVRSALAEWRRTLADTSEDELEVRRITNEQLVPVLSRTLNLSGPLRRSLASALGSPPETEPPPATFTSSTELVGALSIRNFYQTYAATDLEGLLRLLDDLIGGLRNELEP